MERALFAAVLALGASACPVDDAPPVGDASTDVPGTDTGEPEPTADGEPTAGTGTTDGPADTGEPTAWIEAGWGLSDWNAFDEVLPVVVGPQGLAMFSVPLRGRGFHNPPDPGFDNPDIPILQAWVDVDGFKESPGGHLAEVVDYPALFYPSFDDPELLEGVAVWLVLPDTVDPSALLGEEARLHVEMVDADGLRLEDDHVLAIGEAPEPDGG
jgi:hypothetical protein